MEADEWPECTVCGEEFNPRRAALGYKTCLEHGEEKASFVLIPIPKSNSVVGRLEDLVGIAGSHKGR